MNSKEIAKLQADARAPYARAIKLREYLIDELTEALKGLISGMEQAANDHPEDLYRGSEYQQARAAVSRSIARQR